MSLYDMANRLARKLKESDEYSSYQQARRKVMDNERTLEMLQDYQTQRMKLQTKQLSGEELSEDEKQKLENLKEIIDLNADIKKYLDAEYRVSILLDDIQRILFSDLEIGIFTEERDEEKHPD